MEKTLLQYQDAVLICREIFSNKTKDYGTAWRILRAQSLTDQLYIKAERIRSIEESGENLVGESVDLEYVALVNYSIMALIQLETPRDIGLELDAATVLDWYDQKMSLIKALMIKKNHDYGEAWRNMRIPSITDLILQKLLRVKQIEDNNGKTLISEGLDANYMDIVNYALFAMIKLKEVKTI